MIDTIKIERSLKKSQQLAEIYGCKLNLGFSGGKDSVVLKYFAELYGIDYVAHFNNTQIEQYKGMILFIKANYPDVNIIHPDKENSFFELMKTHGLPSIFRRWCCEFLKHSNPKLAEYLVNIMGVRGEESEKRMERGMISVFGKSKRAEKVREKLKATFASTDMQIGCEGGKDKVNIYPIFDLTEKEIWSIIKSEKLIIPDAYADCKRLGCAFCPFASFRENVRTIKDNPNLVKAWLKVLADPEFPGRKYKGSKIKDLNSTGMFYLHIKKSLYSEEDIKEGLNYLNQKNIYGETGMQNFENFLEKNVWNPQKSTKEP
jgi:3'-phosphoadenosine 5'-phosphosulfate sulfotransferase (PAPS reductase)/FAD synthetase